MPVLAIVALVLLLGGRDERAATRNAEPGAGVEAVGAQPSSLTSWAGRNAEAGADGPRVTSVEPDGEASRVSAGAPVTGPEVAPAPATGRSIVSVRSGERVQFFDAPGGEVVARQGDETEFGSPSVFSVRRRTARWVGVTTPLLPNGELGWIRADPGKLRAGYVDYSIVVDLSDRLAQLFHRGTPVRAWPVTIGVAGSETPSGRFAVTDTFRGGLDAAYGCCAVALSATQPKLPSGWLGGNRIAFHGTGGPLGVAASHGCLRSADEDVSALVDTIPLGTPVRIRE